MKPTESLKQVVKVETARAANTDFVDIASTVPAAKPQSSGWDPLEVWRRMIKEPRQRRRVLENQNTL